MSETEETLEEQFAREADLDGSTEAAEPVDGTDDADELIAILDDDEPDEGEQKGTEDDEGTPADPVDRDADEGTTPEEASEAEGSESTESEPSDVADELGKSTEGSESRIPRRRRWLPAAAVVAPVAVMSLLAGAGVALATHGLPRAEPVALAEAAVAEAADWPRPAAGPEPSAEMAARLDRERMTEAQEEVVEAAREMGAAGPSMCLMWVNDVYEASGHDFERVWAASEACQMWCHSTDEEDLRPGMIVAVESTDTSPLAGHIGIYLGDGQIASNETWGGEGVIRTRDVDDWITMFGKVDEVRWGWPEDRDLSKEDDEDSDKAEDKEKDGDGENGNERHGEEDAEGESKESEGQGEEENGER